MTQNSVWETNCMGQCACGKLWDYVSVDGFGNVSTLTNDIEMRGTTPIHVPKDSRLPQCGLEVVIVRMGGDPKQRFFNYGFLVPLDDDGNPRNGAG